MDERALWFIRLILQSQLFELNQGPWTRGQVAVGEQGRMADNFRKGQVELPLCFVTEPTVNMKWFYTLTYVL